MPATALELIERLDESTPRAVVEDVSTLTNEQARYELAKQVGRREIVDDLKALVERLQQQE